MATKTIRQTHTCGHVAEVRQWVASGPDTTVERELTFDCIPCLSRPDTPFWKRSGYADEAAYKAAVARDAEIERIERERAAERAQIAAMPEADRPFTTRAPMSGWPTLDDVAREDFED